MIKIYKTFQNFLLSSILSGSFACAFSQNNPYKKEGHSSSVFASAGNQSWKDDRMKSIYGDIFLFEAGFSHKLNKKSSLEFSAEKGVMETNKQIFFIIDKISIANKLNYTSLNFGLKSDLFRSNDKKTGVYLKGGLKRVFVSEEVDISFEKFQAKNFHDKQNGSQFGYYLGTGIETIIMPRVSGFIETDINRATVPLYEEGLDVGGTTLSGGLRYEFGINSKDRSCPGPWKRKGFRYLMDL